MIANASEHLNKKLWHPEAFRRDFGHIRHDVINCLTGQTVPKASLNNFWQGAIYCTLVIIHTIFILLIAHFVIIYVVRTSRVLSFTAPFYLSRVLSFIQVFRTPKIV